MEKITVAIVDDDIASRNLLKGFLANSAGYTVVADFVDAQAARDWLETHEVGILLCDMQMPGIDGVDLIRNIRPARQNLPIVAVSGFDDYEYLRGCLIQGVEDYLLKHQLTQEKLLGVLDQISVKHGLQAPGTLSPGAMNPVCLENDDFSVASLEEAIREKRLDLPAECLLALVVSPDYPLEGVQSLSRRESLLGALADVLVQIVGSEIRYLVRRKKNGCLVVLLSFPRTQTTQVQVTHTARSLAEKLRRRSKALLHLGLSIGLGAPTSSLGDALAQAAEIEQGLGDKVYLGAEHTFLIHETPRLRYSTVVLPRQMFGTLNEALDLVNRRGASHFFTAVLDQMEALRCEPDLMRSICTEAGRLLFDPEDLETLAWDSFRQKVEASDRFDPVRRLLLARLDEVLADREERLGRTASAAVLQIVRQVGDNFDQDLSLEAISEQLKLSYSHLSREFKKDMGMGFVEYVNRIRINWSKFFLCQKEHSAKEFCGMVGFRSYNYFFLVFKNQVGLTPNEFLSNN